MHREISGDESGFTLTELVIATVIFAVIAVAFLGLYTSLITSTILIKRKAVASTLATNQMEYLKSLPYNSLAVAGGSIIATNPLPASSTTVLNGVTYTTKTSINYVDDAFDGCASYPTQALKQTYCRNYPPPSGASATDTNPEDYKIIHIGVYGTGNIKYAEVDSTVSARVAETASTTGALFVNVIDANGNPIDGATVQVTNSTLTPAVSLSDSTDSNGNAIFYGLPPDTTNYDYKITASKSGYSTLTTIVPSGSLIPTYTSQNVFTQLSSFVTLTIKPQGTDSLLIETTDTSGSPLANVKVYAKGGYKKYTLTTDTQYYYDNMSPSDVRPTTDASGLASIQNLVPGTYILCGDTGATNCKIGNTTYYVAAALPYGGSNPFNPIMVPTYSASSPPAVTFGYGTGSFLQKVRLMLTTNSSFPRVTTLTPYEADQSSSNMSAFAFQLTGVNLPCSSVASSCSTTVKFTQGSSTYTASCTGAAAGVQMNCTVNLSSTVVGATKLVVSSGGNTLTIPVGSMLGGINVVP